MTGSMFGPVSRSCINEEVEKVALRHDLTGSDTKWTHWAVNDYLDADRSVSEIVTDLLHPYAYGVEEMTPSKEEAEFDAIIESISTCINQPRAPTETVRE